MLTKRQTKIAQLTNNMKLTTTILLFSVVAAVTGKLPAPVARRGIITTAYPPTQGLSKYAELSPLSRTIAESVELTINTVTSGATSGAIGYVFSAVWGVPTKLRSLSSLKVINAQAMASFRNWGVLGACFTGFGEAAKLVRGKDDKWNHVCASCATGAFLAKERGPKEMCKGCVGYAGVTMLFDQIGGGGGDEVNLIEKEKQL